MNYDQRMATIALAGYQVSQLRGGSASAFRLLCDKPRRGLFISANATDWAESIMIVAIGDEDVIDARYGSRMVEAVMKLRMRAFMEYAAGGWYTSPEDDDAQY